MPTLLIKNVSEELLKELKKIKAEAGCKTWAELLEYLVKIKVNKQIIIDEKYREKAKKAVDEFLSMSDEVTRKWKEGSVLEEFRKDRGHEQKNFNP
jgi:thiamine biosynthesis lipoprotein ApbE